MSDHGYRGPERRRMPDTCPRYECLQLPENQVEEIAKRAVIMARDEIYLEIGRSLVSKIYVVVGIAFIGLLAWLAKHDLLK